MNSSAVFFTFQYEADDKIGFTDYYIRLFCVYVLGSSAGLQYLHRDVCLARSSTEVSLLISNGLKFNRLSDTKINEEIEICIGDPVIESLQLFTAESVVSYLASCCRNLSEGVLVNINVRGGKKNLMRMIFSSDADQILFFSEKFRENFRASLLRLGSKELDSNKAGKVVKIVAVMRLGDTSVIETPWGKIGGYKGGSSRTDISSFYCVLKNIDKNFEMNSYEINIHSDGFSRLNKSPNGNVANSDLDYYYEHVDNLIEFNNATLAAFDTLNNCKTYFGETDTNLRHLLYDIVTADVIIISPQQRLVPKLIGLAGKKSQKPVLVVLEGNDYTSYQSFQSFGAIPSLCYLTQVKQARFDLLLLKQIFLKIFAGKPPCSSSKVLLNPINIPELIFIKENATDSKLVRVAENFLTKYGVVESDNEKKSKIVLKVKSFLKKFKHG